MTSQTKQLVFILSAIFGPFLAVAVVAWIVAGYAEAVIGLIAAGVLLAAIAGLVALAERLFPDDKP